MKTAKKPVLRGKPPLFKMSFLLQIVKGKAARKGVKAAF